MGSLVLLAHWLLFEFGYMEYPEVSTVQEEREDRLLTSSFLSGWSCRCLYVFSGYSVDSASTHLVPVT